MFKEGQRYKFNKIGALGLKERKVGKCRSGAYSITRTVRAVPDAFHEHVWRAQQLCGIVHDE